MVLSTFVEGETRDVARMHAAIAREILASGGRVKPPACVISGGETTVTLRGTGLGGRNQEFALAAAIDIAGLDRVVILSGGTDGTDGPTDAAGAIADGTTLARAAALGLNAAAFLANNDSYHFFEAARRSDQNRPHRHQRRRRSGNPGSRRPTGAPTVLHLQRRSGFWRARRLGRSRRRARDVREGAGVSPRSPCEP